MKKDKIAKFLEDLQKFDAECEEEHYTDTDEAWKLLNRARDILKAIKKNK